MNVAFVNRMAGLLRGGGEMWDIQMARQLQELGVDVTFYVGKPLRSELSNPPRESTCVPVPTPHIYPMASTAPRLISGILADLDTKMFGEAVKRRLSTEHDIIHINNRPSYIKLLSDFDTPTSIKLNGPLGSRSLFYDTVHPYTNSYELLKNADEVIGTGVTPGIVNEKVNIDVHTINPGVHTSLFTPDGKHAATADGPTILFVGRFAPVKNLTLLLDSFENVRHSHPNTTLLMVGDGPLRSRIEQYANEKDLRENVTFTGYVEHEKLPYYYRAADMFALSSNHESFGMVLIEAMSTGTPIVAPDVGWISNIVTDGKEGRIVDEQTPKHFAAAINELLDYPEIAAQMGQKGREAAVEQHDWQARGEMLKAIFEQMVLNQ